MAIEQAGRPWFFIARRQNRPCRGIAAFADRCGRSVFSSTVDRGGQTRLKAKAQRRTG